mgnify:CR=1 FL=1|jgi:hypothetical protein
MRQKLEQWSSNLRFITIEQINSFFQDKVENFFVGLLVLNLSQDFSVVLVQLERPLANTPN